MKFPAHSRVAVAINNAQYVHPHQRISQLIFNALYQHFQRELDHFYVTDEELAQALENYKP